VVLKTFNCCEDGNYVLSLKEERFGGTFIHSFIHSFIFFDSRFRNIGAEMSVRMAVGSKNREQW
jgi:hypothetical protein